MKQFLTKCGLFIALLTILVIGIEYSLRSIPNSYTYKQGLIEAHPQWVKHLFIGNSVIAHGINPSCFADSTFNMAFPGQHIRYNKAFLEKYLDRLTHLECVYWGISYQSLWEDEYDADNIPVQDDMIAYYHIYLDLSFSYSWRHNSELLSTGDLAFKKWWKYYMAGQPTMRCDSLGLDHSADGKKKKEISESRLDRLVQRHTLYLDKKARHIFRQNVERLHEAASLCTRKGLRLCFIFPPTSRKYADKANKEQLTIIEQTLNEIPGVKVYNYFHDNRFNEEDFNDANHLNSSQGACKLAHILREETLK